MILGTYVSRSFDRAVQITDCHILKMVDELRMTK